MKCDFYGSELDIDFKHTKSNTSCFKVICDKRFHYYINGKLHNDIAFVMKCPIWIMELKGECIDLVYPLNDYQRQQTFENFDISFNNQKNESMDCQIFINSEDKILLLAGKSHIGKTHLANATLNRARSTGYPGIFITIKELENVFMGTQTFQSHDESTNNLNQLKSIYFLVVDELNEINQRYVNEFQDLIDARIQRNNKTIITTNLGPESINDIYGEKIFNRFGIKTKIIPMEGRKYKYQI